MSDRRELRWPGSDSRIIFGSPSSTLRRRALFALLPASIAALLVACGAAPTADRSGSVVRNAEQPPNSIEPLSASPTGVAAPNPPRTLDSTPAATSPSATPTVLGVRRLLDEQVVLALGERRWTPSPLELGLSEVAERAAVSGGQLAIDELSLTSFVETLAREVDRVAVEARLSVGPDLRVSVFPARPGLRVDVAGTAERIRASFSARLDSRAPLESAEVQLAVEEVAPKTVEADLAPAKTSLERALAGPLTLRLDDRTWKMQPRDYAQALSPSPDGGSARIWQVEVADEPFKGVLTKIAPEIAQPPLDARLEWNGGKLKAIRESREGRRLDVEATLSQVKQKVLTDQRMVELVVAPVAPAVDHRRIDQLGIKELVESATTSYTTAVPEKKYNINLAASRLNGVVVPPGATFSFNKEVGPTTLKAGFKWGYGIKRTDSGVTTVPSVAGGICQVATTFFQAVFWAGYQVDTRRSHSYWIPAYTSRGIVGLDTTVDEPSDLDFRFTNTTSGFVMVGARTESSRVIFSLYGKKPAWKVEVGKATITNVTPALTVRTVEENPYLEYGKEIQVQVAREGFDASVVRRVHEGGHVGNAEGGSGNLRTLSVKSHYVPTGTVDVVGTKGKPLSAR